MGAMTPITAEVDAATLAMIDAEADASGLSRADFLVAAARRLAESRAEIRAFLQEGVDDLEAGRTIPHDDVVARLRRRWAERTRV